MGCLDSATQRRRAPDRNLPTPTAHGHWALLRALWSGARECTTAHSQQISSHLLRKAELAKLESLMPHDELRHADLPNIRAERFVLITGQAICWKCHAPIKVSALVLDVHEEMDPEYGDWSVSQGRIMLLTQPGAVFFPCGAEVPSETDVFNLHLEAEAGFSESAWLNDLSI